MSFRIDRGQIIPASRTSVNKKINTNHDFQRILQESISKKDNINISAHAEQRMQERNIKLQDADMEKLKGAMNDLEKKGARESLMLYKDVAFIASVRNRTIITTMQNNEVDLVTNIDSAIIIK